MAIARERDSVRTWNIGRKESRNIRSGREGKRSGCNRSLTVSPWKSSSNPEYPGYPRGPTFIASPLPGVPAVMNRERNGKKVDLRTIFTS